VPIGCTCAEPVTPCCLLCLLLQALTPLTIGRGRAAASALGALWGFGHSTGQLILGLVFVLLKVRLGAWYQAVESMHLGSAFQPFLRRVP
jgi:hypothetical protein